MAEQPIGSPQLAPATALAQLLVEHPELPLAEWHIHASGTLYGHLHDAGVEELGAWAAVLGGEIAPSRDWSLAGRVVRTHTLSSVWRDVRVEVVVVVPVAAVAGSAVAA